MNARYPHASIARWRQRRRPRRPARRGLSIAEALISLAIVASLLTAVASAMSAASKVMEINDDFFHASQAARVSMNRISSEARQASAIVRNSATQLTISPPNAADRVYWLKTDSHQLMLTLLNGSASPPTYVLADNVTGLSFTTNATSSNVTISITVQVGTNVVNLAGSAAVRRLAA